MKLLPLFRAGQVLTLKILQYPAFNIRCGIWTWSGIWSHTSKNSWETWGRGYCFNNWMGPKLSRGHNVLLFYSSWREMKNQNILFKSMWWALQLRGKSAGPRSQATCQSNKSQQNKMLQLTKKLINGLMLVWNLAQRKCQNASSKCTIKEVTCVVFFAFNLIMAH